jgi:hypothetical protein
LLKALEEVQQEEPTLSLLPSKPQDEPPPLSEVKSNLLPFKSRPQNR